MPRDAVSWAVGLDVGIRGSSRGWRRAKRPPGHDERRILVQSGKCLGTGGKCLGTGGKRLGAGGRTPRTPAGYQFGFGSFGEILPPLSARSSCSSIRLRVFSRIGSRDGSVSLRGCFGSFFNRESSLRMRR